MSREKMKGKYHHHQIKQRYDYGKLQRLHGPDALSQARKLCRSRSTATHTREQFVDAGGNFVSGRVFSNRKRLEVRLATFDLGGFRQA